MADDVIMGMNRCEELFDKRTMLGSLGFIPICANGLKPAMAPNARELLSCVSGSFGFCPVCMVGRGGGAEDWDAVDRETPLTMWMVCED